MMTNVLKHAHTKLAFKASTRILVIGLASLSYVLYNVRSTLTTRLRNKIIRLITRGRIEEFLPKKLTAPGTHYAVKHGGLDGFYRLSGYTKTFEPSLNVFSDAVTVASLFGWNINLKFRSTRFFENHLTVYFTGFDLSGAYHEPNLKFVTNEVAALGYIDSTREARVRLQAAPFVGCDVSLQEYESLRFRSGTKPNMGYMELLANRGLLTNKDDIPYLAAALREECRVMDFEPYTDSYLTTGSGDITVTLVDELGLAEVPDSKCIGKLIPQPYDSESIVYSVNRAAEIVTYRDRIEPFVKPKDFSVPPDYRKYINEYSQLTVPESDMHTLSPDDLEYTITHQTKTSQVLGFDQEKDLPDPLNLLPDKTFQKNEVLPEAKPPRNIVNPSHPKRVYSSMYIRPFSELLKKNMSTIIGFGDAEHIQSCFQKVEDQCRGVLGKKETDGTKLDANIAQIWRDAEFSLMKRAYHPDHHKELAVVHRAQYAADPKSRFGTSMLMGSSRRSGERGTSIFNTWIMSCVLYSWIRSLGYNSKEAYSMLGTYGGDDGLTANWGSTESLIAVGEILGIPLKVKDVDPYAPFSFLGIYKFPGMSVYMPDVSRFCSKIAFSHVKGVPAMQVLYRKCEPYVRMYSNIPIVGNLCKSVLRILKDRGFAVDKRYDELCRSGAGYVMSVIDGQLPGPQTEEEYAIVEAYLSEFLDIPLQRLRVVCDMYDNADGFDHFPAGYIHKTDLFSTFGHEALIRDLYITGPAVKKLAGNLLTESLSETAVQNLQNGEQTKNNKEKFQPSSKSTSTTASSSEDSSQITSAASATSETFRRANKRRKEFSKSDANTTRLSHRTV